MNAGFIDGNGGRGDGRDNKFDSEYLHSKYMTTTVVSKSYIFRSLAAETGYYSIITIHSVLHTHRNDFIQVSELSLIILIPSSYTTNPHFSSEVNINDL